MVTYGEGKFSRTVREIEFKLWNKPEPLRLAGKHVGLFNEPVKLANPDGSPLSFTLKLEDHARGSDV
jgi:hypothetical protein